MPKTYDPFLVALSVLIAVWASYDALLLAGRVKVARGTSRPVWLIAGSLAMGIGIWSMHFVGMLALRLPVAVSYDVALVTLSVVVAISSAAVAFTLVSREVAGTDAPVESLSPARPVEGTLAGTETILLAEDDEQLRKLVRGLLDRMGYQVLSAASTEEALAQAGEYRGYIHLLLTDVVMPGEGGHQLARRLAEVRPETRTLFMSGYTDAAIVDHGILERGLHYLQKPFTPSVLARRVRDVLEAD